MKKYFLILLVYLFSYTPLLAQKVGEKAPDFTHNTLSHGSISLSDFRGKVIYLFFFGHG